MTIKLALLLLIFSYSTKLFSKTFNNDNCVSNCIIEHQAKILTTIPQSKKFYKYCDNSEIDSNQLLKDLQDYYPVYSYAILHSNFFMKTFCEFEGKNKDITPISKCVRTVCAKK